MELDFSFFAGLSLNMPIIWNKTALVFQVIITMAVCSDKGRQYISFKDSAGSLVFEPMEVLGSNVLQFGSS